MSRQKEQSKNDCIFCRIAAKEIPSTVVYENDKVMAFLDIKPVSPGHTLVVAKKHFTNMIDIPDEHACEMIKAVKLLSKKILEAVNAQGFNVHINNFRAAGQLVDHVHMHIIPRFEQDALELWHGKEMPEEEMQGIAEKIRNLLK